MKKILVAVDQSKASLATVKNVAAVFGGRRCENITLVHVEKMEGQSILDDLLLSDSEISTLRQSLQGTEYQEMLDQKANRLLNYYQNFLKDHAINGVSVIIKEGHPAEEILATAKEIEADLICLGSRSQRLHNVFLGSVSREVANNAATSVLIVR